MRTFAAEIPPHGGHRNESIHKVINNKDNETERLHETDDEGRHVETRRDAHGERRR